MIKKLHQNNSGSVLIFFALLIFSIFAVMGAVVDLGFARLAQNQMQGAVDAASIIGLQGKDNPQILDPFLRDQQRRQNTSDLVSSIFDDDFDVDNGDEKNLGAGPIINFTGGVTEANALQTIEDPTNDPVYDPVLQINEDNEVYGDMLSGVFDGNAAPIVAPSLYEDVDYTRTDFDSSNPEQSSFLVRLRRTNDLNLLDNLPGESSSGPTIPFLFARLAVIGGEGGYNPRTDGLTIRATAIADSVPAKLVGRPNDVVTPPLLGVASFSLSRAFWIGFTASIPLTINNATGEILSEGVVVGSVLFDERENISPISLGFPILSVPVLDANNIISVVNPTVYVPVFDDIAGENRVIGFGIASVVVTSPSEIQLNPETKNIVAHENASASLGDAFIGLPQASIDLILLRNNELNQTDEIIQVPALVR